MLLLEETDRLLKLKLNIPQSYHIFYVSSATESWEIISQSLGSALGSYHIFNGAFGKKWYNYSSRLSENAISLSFDPQHPLPIDQVNPDSGAIICITQNETGNGSQVSSALLKEIRLKYPDNLIAIDATSSLGGIDLDFTLGDIWFASVQKCLGLPSGMGLLICSPSAIENSKNINENDHYNSLNFIIDNMVNWQTTHTPNIMGIYLLNKVMEDRKTIDKVAGKTRKRLSQWYEFFSGAKNLGFYVRDPDIRSETVLTLEGNANIINTIKEKILSAEIVLGNGYADLKDITFRIANFPALKKKEIAYLSPTAKTHLKILQFILYL